MASFQRLTNRKTINSKKWFSRVFCEPLREAWNCATLTDSGSFETELIERKYIGLASVKKTNVEPGPYRTLITREFHSTKSITIIRLPNGDPIIGQRKTLKFDWGCHRNPTKSNTTFKVSFFFEIKKKKNGLWWREGRGLMVMRKCVCVWNVFTKKIINDNFLYLNFFLKVSFGFLVVRKLFVSRNIFSRDFIKIWTYLMSMAFVFSGTHTQIFCLSYLMGKVFVDRKSINRIKKKKNFSGLLCVRKRFHCFLILQESYGKEKREGMRKLGHLIKEKPTLFHPLAT